MILQNKHAPAAGEITIRHPHLAVRTVVDDKYIIPKTVDFIKAKAATKKPFYIYVGYSQVHPPTSTNPAFAGRSPERGGVYSDILGEMDYEVGKILDAIKEAGVDENQPAAPKS